jgi:hypothetical protein
MLNLRVQREVGSPRGVSTWSSSCGPRPLFTAAWGISDMFRLKNSFEVVQSSVVWIRREREFQVDQQRLGLGTTPVPIIIARRLFRRRTDGRARNLPVPLTDSSCACCCQEASCIAEGLGGVIYVCCSRLWPAILPLERSATTDFGTPVACHETSRRSSLPPTGPTTLR